MNQEERARILGEMPVAQLRELARLISLYPESTWHMNECGCCACVHPRGQKHNRDAYIVGSDGSSEYLGEKP